MRHGVYGWFQKWKWFVFFSHLHLLLSPMSKQQYLLISHWRGNERYYNSCASQWHVSYGLQTLIVNMLQSNENSSVKLDFCAVLWVWIKYFLNLKVILSGKRSWELSSSVNNHTLTVFMHQSICLQFLNIKATVLCRWQNI